MKLRWLTLILLSALSASVLAGTWAFAYRPASVKYVLYGNSLGDPVSPAKDDTKIAFEVRGQAAREMFNSIGPDRRDLCSSEDGTRFRSRDEDRLSCTRSKGGDYSCYFGFDLKSGKSVGGSIC